MGYQRKESQVHKMRCGMSSLPGLKMVLSPLKNVLLCKIPDFQSLARREIHATPPWYSLSAKQVCLFLHVNWSPCGHWQSRGPPRCGGGTRTGTPGPRGGSCASGGCRPGGRRACSGPVKQWHLYCATSAAKTRASGQVLDLVFHCLCPPFLGSFLVGSALKDMGVSCRMDVLIYRGGTLRISVSFSVLVWQKGRSEVRPPHREQAPGRGMSSELESCASLGPRFLP